MNKIFFIVLFPFLLYAGSFERAMAFVLDHEKEIYCHDGGWESKFGICSQWYPKEDIKNMTKERAIEIYYKDYWCRMNCQIQPDSNFALLIFDTAVLFGQPTAERMLRKCFYDKKYFMRLRIEMTQKVIENKPEKIKNLTSWVQRMLDLQEAVFFTSTKE